MSDTNFLDILIKQSFGFPSTSENKKWHEETAVKYNNYFNGEDLLIDIIPQDPDFDISGIVRTASEIGLNENKDFVNYSDNSNKYLCSIVDDSTGTIRRFKQIILEECPELGNDNKGASWFKLDISNNNILTDALQFNYKQYIDNSDILIQPYLYSVFTQLSLGTSSPNLPFGEKGGNWFFDLKSGILCFKDFGNFSNEVQTNTNFKINFTNNKPVISFYKYIGKKGINNYIPTHVNNNNYNLLQIASTNIASGISDEIIDSYISYQIINDLSLNLTAIQNNSKYKILLNFNYLSSNYYDTLLNIALVYKVNYGSENLIGKYLLGNENTSFKHDFFSNNFYQDISSVIGDNINFYIKAKISSSTDNNTTNYSTLDDIYKPKIILSSLGNVLNIEEVNNY